MKKPEVIPRTEWQALPTSLPVYGSNNDAELAEHLHRITIHHDAMYVDFGSFNKHLAALRVFNHQRAHMHSNGWADIGYHYLIDPYGNIYSGRPLNAIGSHTEGFNSGNVGICLLGNFELQSPTTEAMKSLNDLVLWLAYTFKIDPGEIKGHKDYNSTACPGHRLFSRLNTLRASVENALSPESQPPPQRVVKIFKTGEKATVLVDGEEVTDAHIAIGVVGDSVAMKLDKKPVDPEFVEVVIKFHDFT
jgi:hypothetical protein